MIVQSVANEVLWQEIRNPFALFDLHVRDSVNIHTAVEHTFRGTRKNHGTNEEIEQVDDSELKPRCL